MSEATMTASGLPRWATWLAVVVGVAVLSFIMGGLETLLAANVGSTALSALFLIVTAVLAVGAGKWLASRHGGLKALHLLWAVTIIGMVFIGVTPGAQWLFIPLFAVLGFAVAPLLGVPLGASAIVVAAIIDQAWQGLVLGAGDDVLMWGMVLSAVVGAGLAGFGRQKPEGEDDDA